MTRNEEWSGFLENLLSRALQQLETTKEYEYRRKRQEHIDEMLTTNLTIDQKCLVDEILFELGSAAEHETALIYRQGLKDCVWLLKNLGVLA